MVAQTFLRVNQNHCFSRAIFRLRSPRPFQRTRFGFFLWRLLFNTLSAIMCGVERIFLMPRLFLAFALLSALPLAAQTNAWHSPATIAETLDLPQGVWDGTTLTYSNETHTVVFHSDSRRLTVNNLLCYLNYPARGNIATGDWQICAADIRLLRDAYLPAPSTNAAPLHIVLDPGHGGADNGTRATTRNLREKILTLDIAQRLQTSLSNTPHRVTLTRTGDQTLTLSNRTEFARACEADLFVSIHANNAPSAKAEGIETFALALQDAPSTNGGSDPRGIQPGSPFNTSSSALACSIHRRLLQPGYYPDKTAPADRGLKRAYFHVLRNAPCPAVLVEVGFLSNPEEARRLSQNDYIDSIVAAIRQGILDYTSTPAFHPKKEDPAEKDSPPGNNPPPEPLTPDTHPENTQPPEAP